MSKELETVLEFIKRRTDDLVGIINDKYETTDGGTNIAKKLRGKLCAYYAVKYFIENGMKDV
tara:strand:+ start:363 stop:548 length:186 start_codon:yes stop_codon:yes gene_type:complete